MPSAGPEIRSCTHCSTKLPPAADHCPSCGAPVSKKNLRVLSWRTVRAFAMPTLVAVLAAALFWGTIFYWLRFQLALVEPELIEQTPKPKLTAADPCLLFHRIIDKNGASGDFAATMTDCPPRTFLDAAVDDVEIVLNSGVLITRRTDLFVPDSIPLAVTRCYRLWDDRTLPFGMRTNNAWDMEPIGSRYPYTYVDVIFCDGRRVHYDRISKGTDYADAVYEHRETATAFFESRFRWNGNGWDLKLKDGTVFLFPEAYNAKRPVEGAIVGLRDGRGNSIKVERTRKRDLQRITSPSGHWIAFDVDPSGRIVKAEDDLKRTVNYTYDAAGRLVLVAGPRGATRYVYERAQLVEVEENGKKLVDFGYRNGRIAEVSFRNGTYRFRYEFDQSRDPRLIRAFVQSPDGKVAKVDIPPAVR
jgi:YD repeat-containing protein